MKSRILRVLQSWWQDESFCLLRRRVELGSCISSAFSSIPCKASVDAHCVPHIAECPQRANTLRRSSLTEKVFSSFPWHLCTFHSNLINDIIRHRFQVMPSNAQAANEPAERASEAATSAEQLVEENENVEAVRPRFPSSFSHLHVLTTRYLTATRAHYKP